MNLGFICVISIIHIIHAYIHNKNGFYRIGVPRCGSYCIFKYQMITDFYILCNFKGTGLMDCFFFVVTLSHLYHRVVIK